MMVILHETEFKHTDKSLFDGLMESWFELKGDGSCYFSEE
jgi:hypothetical protein